MPHSIQRFENPGSIDLLTVVAEVSSDEYKRIAFDALASLREQELNPRQASREAARVNKLFFESIYGPLPRGATALSVGTLEFEGGDTVGFTVSRYESVGRGVLRPLIPTSVIAQLTYQDPTLLDGFAQLHNGVVGTGLKTQQTVEASMAFNAHMATLIETMHS